MIPMVSPRFGLETSAASLSFTGGRALNVRGDAIYMAYRDVDIPTTMSMPTWMASPLEVLEKSKRRNLLMNASKRASGLGRPWLPLNSSKIVATGVSDGLLVRGGAGAVTAGPLLGAALFATACLSAVLERWTKVGAVVGAPLLSFGTFCLIRCVLGLVLILHTVFTAFYHENPVKCKWSHLQRPAYSFVNFCAESQD